ncbi:MAG TPA: dihydrofolate reductase family protein [Kineosporiaceae bacterium]|nr:dihydrofolate reductase family protein [Kineosporiaceae bacterium]
MSTPSTTPRPYVLLSAAVSLDGYLDDTAPDRLLLSGAEDLDRVDEVRAGVDAILIGARTMRRDNPRLLVNSPDRQAARVARGLPAQPLRVTVTGSGDLDPGLRFWHHGGARLVFTVDAVVQRVRTALTGLAEVVSTGPRLDWGRVLDELGARGIGRLMVEGGGTVHTQLMAADLVDELHLAVAPLLVGDPAAPRFLGPATYPGGSRSRLRLLQARTVGDVVLLRYAPRQRRGAAGAVPSADPSLDLPADPLLNLPADRPLPPGTAVPPGRATDRFWMRRAIELSRRCPPSATAYSVGAILVAQDGTELASGHSRETDPRVHAEEAALAKLGPDPRLAGATLYSTLEPCSRRSADRTPCARLVIAAGVRRVVIAWREPPLFVDCDGVELLAGAGIAVEELPELAEPARAVNAHLIGGAGS